MAGAGTNERIAGLIRSSLEKGSKVHVLGWQPEEGVRITGIEVDMVKGLENPLIRELKPTWNIQN